MKNWQYTTFDILFSRYNLPFKMYYDPSLMYSYQGYPSKIYNKPSVLVVDFQVKTLKPLLA